MGRGLRVIVSHEQPIDRCSLHHMVLDNLRYIGSGDVLIEHVIWQYAQDWSFGAGPHATGPYHFGIDTTRGDRLLTCLEYLQRSAGDASTTSTDQNSLPVDLFVYLL